MICPKCGLRPRIRFHDGKCCGCRVPLVPEVPSVETIVFWTVLAVWATVYAYLSTF